MAPENFSVNPLSYDSEPPESPPPAPPPSPSPSPSLSGHLGSPPVLLSPGPSPLSAAPISKSIVVRTVLLVVASVVVACVIILLYYAIVRRSRCRRRRRAAAASQPPTVQAPIGHDDELRDELLAVGEDDQPYHVWNIRTVGLDEYVIGAISAVAYRKEEGLVEGTDCAVCLGEFLDGEMLRLLPKCSHAFHIPCIDTWLRSHVNCPLCRAPILAPALGPPLPVPAAADVLSSASLSPSSSFASTAVDDQPGSSRREQEVWVRIDLGDGVSGDDGDRPGSDTSPVNNGRHRHASPQRVRRSVSMDPSALGVLLQSMGLIGISSDDNCKPTSEDHPSAAKEGQRRGNSRRRATLVGLGPSEINRSMSSGGERLFPAMPSGRIRGAILPL